MREFTHRLTIDAPPTAVLDAFFDPDALSAWWHVKRSLCVPRSMGSFAVEWEPTEWTDDVLGRLGGAFRGVVIEFKPGREFFVADGYWLPPEGEPIGPMALEVRCATEGSGTVVYVRQAGEDDGPRWTRYFELLATGFTTALEEMKVYVEKRPLGTPEAGAG